MKKFLLLLLSLIFAFNQLSVAQNPGDLDLSFGSGGVVVTSAAQWTDIVLQSDGKLLAVSDIIARFNANGTLDGSFGINGTDTIKIDDTVYNHNAIAIQSDGKILVICNYLYGSVEDFLLIRYNSDGSPDNSFNGGGVVRTDFNSGSIDYGCEVAIQADGKIVVAGASGQWVAVCRYNIDGSLDSSFDNDGKLIINTLVVNINEIHPVYMKLQSDGKIAVGSADNLVRLNSDGSIDNSFGINGVVGLPYGMNDLNIQSDGKVILAGNAGVNFAVVRLDPNGSVDSSFGNGGITTTHWYCMGCSNGGALEGTSIALQPDGRILASGYNRAGLLWNVRNFVLVRYNPNGSMDSSFGTDGMVITSVPGAYTQSYESVMTPDMKIVLAGYGYYDDDGYMARYHLGWLLDVHTVSGNDKRFTISPNPTVDWINIEAAEMENSAWHLEVRDITGRTMLREDIAVVGGSIQKKISLQNLPAGLYMLQLDNGKEKKVSRVVKY